MLVLVLVLVLVPAPIDVMDLNLPVSYGLPGPSGGVGGGTCAWSGPEQGAGNLQALFGKRPTEKDPAKGTSLAVDFT